MVFSTENLFFCRNNLESNLLKRKIVFLLFIYFTYSIFCFYKLQITSVLRQLILIYGALFFYFVKKQSTIFACTFCYVKCKCKAWRQSRNCRRPWVYLHFYFIKIYLFHALCFAENANHRKKPQFSLSKTILAWGHTFHFVRRWCLTFYIVKCTAPCFLYVLCIKY